MSQIVDEALIFATKVHAGQVRKIEATPYILHPCEVASIIATLTNDCETIAAGLLHDTIEDCGVDGVLIREKFGMRVYNLVQSETEDKLISRPASETWKERKEASLAALKLTKDESVKIMWLADKLSNMRSFYRLYLRQGQQMWEHFNQKDAKQQEWYYRTIAKYLESLSHTVAYKEYIELINKVFGRES